MWAMSSAVPSRLSGTVDRNEVFTNDTDSNVMGSAPKINYSRAEKPIGKLPIYFGVSTEYATLIRTDKTASTVNERGLTRAKNEPEKRYMERRLAEAKSQLGNAPDT